MGSRKHMSFIMVTVFTNSLTEVSDLIGFSFRFKEGVHRNTHKACSDQCGRPARNRKTPLSKRVKNKGLNFLTVHFDWAKNLQR